MLDGAHFCVLKYAKPSHYERSKMSSINQTLASTKAQFQDVQGTVRPALRTTAQIPVEGFTRYLVIVRDNVEKLTPAKKPVAASIMNATRTSARQVVELNRESFQQLTEAWRPVVQAVRASESQAPAGGEQVSPVVVAMPVAKASSANTTRSTKAKRTAARAKNGSTTD